MGYLLGVATALTASFQNSFYKKLSGADPFVLNWCRFVIALPIMAVLVTVFHAWRIPEAKFFLFLLGLSLPVELAQSYFYVSAFQRSPQSIIGPLFSLSVIFLVPLSYIFLHEIPSFLGFIGIISIILGPFFLGWQGRGSGVSQSFIRVFREPGSWRMMVSAFFAAVAVTFSKFSYRFVPPLLFAFAITAALAVAISVLLLIRRISPLKKTNANVFGMGAAYGIGQAMHYTGLSFLLAAYFISFKRLSILFDVLFGYFMHGEDHFRERFTGAVLMVAGLLLIAFGN